MPTPKTYDLRQVLDEICRKISDWEADIERAKLPREYYTTRLGNNRLAALLHHSSALQMSRFGSHLLRESLEYRRDGILFGLTKRPVIESYTREFWLEFIADDERAKAIFTRDESNFDILSGKRGFPTLNQLWKKLQESKYLVTLRDTINWIQERRTWWNDAAHIGPNAVYMGWSNEYADVFNANQKIVSDLHTLVEIFSQCSGRFHVLHNGGGDSEETTRIHREGVKLRAKLTSLEN